MLRWLAQVGTLTLFNLKTLPQRRGSVVSSGFMATADALLRKRDYLGLLAVSNRHGEAIARVVQKVLDFTTKNPSAEFAQVREIAETEGTRVTSNLNNRVIYLADIGMIAPMLGLLGTVFGIIRSFGALGGDLGAQRYALLSSGVSQALINTAAGLAIGIPAMICYAYFRGRVNRIISELDARCAMRDARCEMRDAGCGMRDAG